MGQDKKVFLLNANRLLSESMGNVSRGRGVVGGVSGEFRLVSSK